MSRYSSDSDSSGYHRKSRRKRRSSSSVSSDSSRHRRSKSSKQRSSSRYQKGSKRYNSKSRRRSRSKSKTGSRHSRSLSKDRRRRRSHSREKYRRKHYYKSRSRSKGHSSKYHSRSTSTDSKNSSSSTSSKSSSATSTKKNFPVPTNLVSNPEEQLREQLLKAIRAAESADHQLKQQGVLPKGVKSRNDISSLTSSKPQSEVIRDINADEFVQKTFTSSKHNKENNMDDFDISNAIDESNTTDEDANSIFHSNFFIDPKAKFDRWVRKLYQIRQKAICGEPMLS